VPILSVIDIVHMEAACNVQCFRWKQFDLFGELRGSNWVVGCFLQRGCVDRGDVVESGAHHSWIW
jgi:hypothetical protein